MTVPGQKKRLVELIVQLEDPNTGISKKDQKEIIKKTADYVEVLIKVQKKLDADAAAKGA